MKKILSRSLRLVITSLVFIALTAFPVLAEKDIVASGVCGDNLTWSLDSTGALEISGSGDMWDYDTTDPEWHRYDINTLILNEGITKIGSHAFCECNIAGTIVIPDSVVTIGESAFSRCENITGVHFGNGVETIGDWAFCRCYNLVDVKYGENVTYIGVCAFYYDPLTTSITLPEKVEFIGNWAYDETNVIKFRFLGNSPKHDIFTGNRVTIDGVGYDIKLYYINGKSGWTTPRWQYWKTVPLDTTEDVIDSGKCGDNLTWQMTWDGTLTISGTGAMWEWKEWNLSDLPWYKYRKNTYNSNVATIFNVIVEEGVTGISDYSFAYCDDVRLLQLPSTLETIDWSALYLIQSSGGYNITVNEGGKYFSVDGALYCTDESDTILIRYPESSLYSPDNKHVVHLPSNLTKIGYAAMDHCYQIDEVYIPHNVTEIDDFAFNSCSNLSNIYFAGTEEEWNSIIIGKSNDALANAAIHFLGNIIPGDMDGNGKLNSADAIYLLYNIMFGKESYPLMQDADVDGNGKVNSGDAVYLLYHIMFGSEEYPLYQ